MKKTNRLLLFFLSFVICFPSVTYAATENDLREITGIGRLDDKELQKKINFVKDKLSREEDYNDLVTILKENKINVDIKEDELIAEKNAYESMIDNFTNGVCASKVIDSFSEYDSYTYYASQTSYGEMDADYIDTKNSKERLNKLKKLEKIMKSKKDIGSIGEEGIPPTKNGIRVQATSKKLTEIYTSKKEKIYSIFSGSILNKDKNSVTIHSGETINITYSNISTKLKIGEKVKQGDVIGKAKNTCVSISMEISGSKQNILLAYGTNGQRWYKYYLSENPWEDDAIDFTEVKDKVKSSKKKEEKSSTYILDGGEKKELNVEQPSKNGENQKIIDEDPFAQNQ